MNTCIFIWCAYACNIVGVEVVIVVVISSSPSSARLYQCNKKNKIIVGWKEMCRGQWIFYVLYVDLAKPKSGASDHNKVLQGISWREVNNVPGVNSH